jgi:HSP20 family protein
MSWAGPGGNNVPTPPNPPNPPNPPINPPNLHAYPNGGSFWDYVTPFDPLRTTGLGVDHTGSGPQFPPGFPFHQGEHGPHAGAYPPWAGPWAGRGGWGPWGGGRRSRCRRGSRCRHEHTGVTSDNEGQENQDEAMVTDNEAGEKEKDGSPETMRESPEGLPEASHEHAHHGPPHCAGHSRRGWGRWRGGRRHGPHGHPGHPGFMPFHAPPQPPPYPGTSNSAPGFDFGNAMRNFGQTVREYIEQARATATAAAARGGEDSDTFSPPVDTFDTEKAYVLHIALPGAKKEDIAINWDPAQSVLNITGIVHRPGDEAFLQTLSASERRVGLFERTIKLPPAGGEGEDVDGLAISAKMEEGILIVTIPKLEKEWTEIRKVDIE